MAHGAAVRDRNKERHWRKIVRGRRNGESIRAYCRVHGVNEAAFYWWRRELARRDATQPATFVPVVIEPPVASERVECMAVVVCEATNDFILQLSDLMHHHICSPG